jgi:hypothetical protein
MRSSPRAGTVSRWRDTFSIRVPWSSSITRKRALPLWIRSSSPRHESTHSRLTGSELISAFAIKVRTMALDREDADLLLRQFREDIVLGKLEVFSVGESEFVLTEQLVEKYAFDFRLRALDALQLAVACELRNQHLVDHFVAADKVLCEVAAAEGFPVINPEGS